jgi:chromate transporter
VSRLVIVLVTGAVLWFAPIVLLEIWRPNSIFVDQAWFFSKAAVVTFGGAYSVLSYVAQRAVEAFGWLRPGEMVDGLALAETTPGPLILVLQFVAYLGAFRADVGLPPALAGAIGGLIALWTTFVPCFVWIFAGAPYIEAVRNQPALNLALASITAAVVGVILNLSVWFAFHTLFKSVQAVDWGFVHLDVPVWSTLSLPATVLTAFAAFATFRLKLPMPATLAGAAVAGLLCSFV